MADSHTVPAVPAKPGTDATGNKHSTPATTAKPAHSVPGDKPASQK